MAQNRFGRECERCRDKLRKGEEVYFGWARPYIDHNHRFPGFLLCRQCAEDHVGDYVFMSYLIYVGGVSK